MRDFRNYARAEARFGEGLTVVHGSNGAGKSNLLEAMYFGCTGRSPRTRSERELVRFGEQATRVAVRLCDDSGRHELSVGLRPGQPKRMSHDGAPVERLLDVADRPLLGVFVPDRLTLLKGPPSIRRAHVDELVAAAWPARAFTRREYSRVLAQRNALLARIRAGRASPASLPSWDSELASVGAALCADRSRAVALVAGEFAARATQLGCAGETTLEYRPGARAREQAELLAELAARRPRDIERGFSGYGPHRDELAILRDGRELRLYGSQGEQRLALLALLLP